MSRLAKRSTLREPWYVFHCYGQKWSTLKNECIFIMGICHSIFKYLFMKLCRLITPLSLLFHFSNRATARLPLVNTLPLETMAWLLTNLFLRQTMPIKHGHVHSLILLLLHTEMVTTPPAVPLFLPLQPKRLKIIRLRLHSQPFLLCLAPALWCRDLFPYDITSCFCHGQSLVQLYHSQKCAFLH